ncbi:MAG: hypothetical protein B6242_11385 [Anaerolineaceae bacterium 4572_78]|nr:MAG: hypothetical protein B6242_11385 [Anaerolineaceae bacterium 4572_78]
MTVKTLIPTKNLNEIYDIDNRASLNGDIILDFGFDLDVDTTIYSESDGKPISDNTEQYKKIVLVTENLKSQYADDPDVFVAEDLLWYTVRGNNKQRRAPDTMVVFGRPKGKRGSYKQWLEDNIPPQVVFEIMSPSNTRREMKEERNEERERADQAESRADQAKSELEMLRKQLRALGIEPQI